MCACYEVVCWCVVRVLLRPPPLRPRTPACLAVGVGRDGRRGLGAGAGERELGRAALGAPPVAVAVRVAVGGLQLKPVVAAIAVAVGRGGSTSGGVGRRGCCCVGRSSLNAAVLQDGVLERGRGRALGRVCGRRRARQQQDDEEGDGHDCRRRDGGRAATVTVVALHLLRKFGRATGGTRRGVERRKAGGRSPRSRPQRTKHTRPAMQVAASEHALHHTDCAEETQWGGLEEERGGAAGSRRQRRRARASANLERSRRCAPGSLTLAIGRDADEAKATNALSK